MTRRDAIQKLRENLLRRRDALRKSLNTTRTQLETAQGRDVGDSVDVALDAEYHEISSQLAEVESNELTQIEVALERIDSGEYGVCEDCGRNIPLARLQAVPYATVCIKCQRERESVGNRGSEAAFFVGNGESDLLLDGNGAGVS
jgi:DnaK suppressor protein